MSLSTNDNVQIRPCLLVIMGVSGCGKTTLAKGLDQYLDWPFQEGDSFHSQHNIQKMSEGKPLTDSDRWPWLEKCHAWLKACAEEHGGKGVLTCSALKRSYRDFLRKGIGKPFYFVNLKVPYDVLLHRIEKREGHFMPASLLDTQLKSFEPLQVDEPHIEIDMSHPLETVIRDTLMKLQQL
ncbi:MULTISPECIES: gluconokinase [Commensalibacter]|uniref:gluconokinase n=1 Tax=Commensalibacter TaxID=1079922 RepID=UPI0018DDB224|nr:MULTISPECIES: gluconokinase [Commensalibacter]MBH9973718.1 gluconokinase [Commensalibacter melissae]MBI0017135.1 gluconokinase [Commensalibacter sp. B14384M2]MBI0019144.1 gluconokinase [Commensalibacter sp. W8133]MBI0049569.1 gluconokinase [Commensalibacter sp. B14384M3]MBI0179627.1 gluconokinase [Commensalibacter sp. W8163]